MTVPRHPDPPVPTTETTYLCPEGHLTVRRFHAQSYADQPMTWECDECHKEATFLTRSRVPVTEKVPDPKRAPKKAVPVPAPVIAVDEPEMSSHVQALLGRRSKDELEALLKSRMDAYSRGDGHVMAQTLYAR